MSVDVAARLTARVSLAAVRHMTVAAGLARGMDTAAHRVTLDTGGRTVAVIGTGIGRVYLTENRGLQSEIANRVLVLSDEDTRPWERAGAAWAVTDFGLQPTRSSVLAVINDGPS